MAGGDVAHVEGRILAHQDDVDVLLEVQRDRLAEQARGFAYPLHAGRAGPGGHAAFGPSKVARAIDEQPIPARLRRLGERKARVTVDIDPLQRIHLNGYAQCHAVYRPRCYGRRAVSAASWFVIGAVQFAQRLGRI